jgi:hypothetical protein
MAAWSVPPWENDLTNTCESKHKINVILMKPYRHNLARNGNVSARRLCQQSPRDRPTPD